ncbi:hypothetical protein D3C73_997170 [compost metagenome]
MVAGQADVVAEPVFLGTRQSLLTPGDRRLRLAVQMLPAAAAAAEEQQQRVIAAACSIQCLLQLACGQLRLSLQQHIGHSAESIWMERVGPFRFGQEQAPLCTQLRPLRLPHIQQQIGLQIEIQHLHPPVLYLLEDRQRSFKEAKSGIQLPHQHIDPCQLLLDHCYPDMLIALFQGRQRLLQRLYQPPQNG